VNLTLATAGYKIRNELLVELRRLTGWFNLNYGTNIIVIGGWAVFSYNPYLGSFDIDCVGPREPFYAQLDLYMTSHGYELVKRDQIGLTKFFVKRVFEKNSYIGDVHIDACSFDDGNYFKEDNTKRLPYGLCAKTEYINRREINGTFIWVPKKELLFLYKLKALRDRNWVLANGQLNPGEKNYLQGKIDKDKMDLLALLDPRHGPLEPVRILDIINEFDLIFAADTIKDLPNEQDTIQKYGEKRQEVDGWVRKIRESLGI
jgi:hypothetical protein